MGFLFVTLSLLCLQVTGSVHESESAEKADMALPDGPYIDALKYLGRYGYLDYVDMKNFSMFETFERSVKSFQVFVGLRESGESEI